MKRFFLFAAGVFCVVGAASAALPHVGLYQTVDDETNAPKSIVALYEYADGDDVELAGRIVALYGADGRISETIANPTKIADSVPGAPKYVGLDIIWDMEWDADDRAYDDGKIMDPKSGKIYSAEITQATSGKLDVRGKIGPFGRTQHWNLMDSSAVPSELQNLNTENWKPLIRK